MLIAHSLPTPLIWPTNDCFPAEEEDADNMEEINTNNIINNGRRTRGKKIDFTNANTDDLGDDDDDADDGDFEAKEEGQDVDMQD